MMGEAFVASGRRRAYRFGSIPVGATSANLYSGPKLDFSVAILPMSARGAAGVGGSPEPQAATRAVHSTAPGALGSDATLGLNTVANVPNDGTGSREARRPS